MSGDVWPGSSRDDATIALRDVTMRDGLQDEQPIPTARKLAVYEALVSAGVRDLELTSFVRPDRVPAMADAEALAAATASDDGVRRWALVLNERGAQRALASGMANLQYVISASETHSSRNAGRSVGESLDELGRIRAAASPGAVRVELTVATAFGCPFDGPIPPSAVESVVEQALALGVDGISLADTIGTAVPREVAGLVGAVVASTGDVPVGIHVHDTRGLGVVNVLAAFDAGAVRADASLGGLGGCPFAPGASGNVALEDLVHLFEASGVDTGIDLDRLLAASRLACELVGRPVASHVGVAGPRFAVVGHE